MDPVGTSIVASTKTQAAGAPVKRRVLLVEDDHLSRAALGRLLEASGYQISAVQTVGQAVDDLASEPGVVLLDLMLPDGNGVSVLKCVRAERLKARVAVITALAEPLVLAEVQRLRPDGFFRKPLDVNALLRWLGEGGGG